MFCHQCGNQAPDDAEFCFSCGTRLIVDDTVQQRRVTLVEDNQIVPAENKPADTLANSSMSAIDPIPSPLLGCPISDSQGTDGPIRITKTHPIWLFFFLVMVASISALVLIAEILFPFANALLEWMPKIEWWGISIVGLIGLGSAITLIVSPKNNKEQR